MPDALLQVPLPFGVSLFHGVAPITIVGREGDLTVSIITEVRGAGPKDECS